MIRALRRQTYDLLDEGGATHRAGRWVRRVILLAIVANVLAAIFETVPVFFERYSVYFYSIEIVSLALFTLEYGLRLWAAPENGQWRHLPAWKARFHMASSVSGVIDLMAILPFYVVLLGGGDFRVLVVFRILRLAKLSRYSSGVHSLVEAIVRERRSLVGALMIVASIALTSAAVMYDLERDVQPEKFGTLPDAVWWAFVTITTLGYGDVVPVTMLGKIIAIFTMVCGVLTIALPVAILGAAFAQEVHKRDFVVTWNMVARVPLFSELSAREISEIVDLLKTRTVGAGEVIVRRGEQAHSMFFVASGEVEIEFGKGKSVQLGEGHFFGEIALLKHTHRSARVVALRRTHLLVLDDVHFHALMERQPDLADKVKETAKQRLASDLRTNGDIAKLELEEPQE